MNIVSGVAELVRNREVFGQSAGDDAVKRRSIVIRATCTANSFVRASHESLLPMQNHVRQQLCELCRGVNALLTKHASEGVDIATYCDGHVLVLIQPAGIDGHGKKQLPDL